MTIEKKNRVFRLWLGIYFTLSIFSLLTLWPESWSPYLSILPSSDLSGSYRGLQSRETWDFAFLDTMYFKVSLFVFTLIACVLFCRYRRPLLNSFLLFLAVAIGGNCGPGRSFMFEAMGLVSLSVLVSNLISHFHRYDSEQRSVLNLRFGLLSIGYVYFAAFLRKVEIFGFSWANEYTIPLLLQYRNYLEENGASSPVAVFKVAEMLETYLKSPSSLTFLLAVGVLIVEGTAPFLVLYKWTREKIVPWLWLLINFGFTVFAGVLSKPIVVSIIVLSLPEKPVQEKGRIKWMMIGWLVLVIAISKILPTDRYQMTTKVFPFSHFTMFRGWHLDPDSPKRLQMLYFKPLGPASGFSMKEFLEPVRQKLYFISVRMAVESRGRPGMKGSLTCDFIQQQYKKYSPTPPIDFEIWVREVFIEDGQPNKRDFKIFDCKNQDL